VIGLRIDELLIPEEAKNIIIESSIQELYPPQKDALLAGALDGENLVLASPTASGKTLVAELCIIKHVLEKEGKVLYLTPLRALASEKYVELKKYSRLQNRNGEKIRVAISTGDYDSSDPWLGRYDIIICTNEKADSLLRHKPKWIYEVSLVISDEIHIINDVSRGPTLEVVLTRLKDINPSAQFLALSATIRNAKEIAEWLQAKSITTEWRPVKLLEGVYLRGVNHFNDGTIVGICQDDSKEPSINLAMNIINKKGQALIFAETRRKAVTISRKAASALNNVLTKQEKKVLKIISETILSTGERTRISDQLAKLIQNGTSFHHAGLTSTQRRIIEDAFRDGRLKIISATPTLAAGVNLPARIVVISSYERYESGYGRYPISVLEYKQMAGRAGRPKYDSIGETLLIARTEDERDYLMKSYVSAKPERIWSKLAVERIMRSHVLATIASEFTRTEQGLYEFFDKTYYAHQYDSRSIKKVILGVLRFLHREKMFDVDGSNIFATKFGRRVSELYIDPVSGVIIRDFLTKRVNKVTELTLLHMVCHTPDIYPKYYPRKKEISELDTYIEAHREELAYSIPDEFEDKIQYEVFLGEIKSARILSDWIEENTEDDIMETFSIHPGDLFRLVKTTEWLLYSSYEICRLFTRKDLLPPILDIRNRIEKGVKKELLPLVSLDGIGRIRGRILFNSGFKTTSDLKRTPLKELTNLPMIGSTVAKRIKEQVGGLVKKNEWDKVKEDKILEQTSITDFN
jgi:helicase